MRGLTYGRYGLLLVAVFFLLFFGLLAFPWDSGTQVVWIGIGVILLLGAVAGILSLRRVGRDRFPVEMVVESGGRVVFRFSDRSELSFLLDDRSIRFRIYDYRSTLAGRYEGAPRSIEGRAGGEHTPTGGIPLSGPAWDAILGAFEASGLAIVRKVEPLASRWGKNLGPVPRWSVSVPAPP